MTTTPATTSPIDTSTAPEPGDVTSPLEDGAALERARDLAAEWEQRATERSVAGLLTAEHGRELRTTLDAAGVSSASTTPNEPTRSPGPRELAAVGHDVDRILRENGLSPEPHLYDSSIHSWRCEHPDRYGPCACFQELRDDLTAALAARTAELAAWQNTAEAYQRLYENEFVRAEQAHTELTKLRARAGSEETR